MIPDNFPDTVHRSRVLAVCLLQPGPDHLVRVRGQRGEQLGDGREGQIRGGREGSVNGLKIAAILK